MHQTSADGVRPSRRLHVAAATVAALLLIALAAFLYLRHHTEPIARQRIIATLENRFHCKVELDGVHVSLLHGLQVSGNGLRIMAIGGKEPTRPGSPPMLSARTFQFDTAFGDLIFHRESAVTAYVQGLVITLPAANERAPLQQGDPAKKDHPRDSVFLNKLVATESTLVLESSDPAKPPITFDFNKLILFDPGKNLPFVYETILTNPKPVGEIHSTGHIGPWVFTNARATPVDGNFTFDHADLSSINGLSGIASCAGRLTGTLGQMAVHGTTDTPDFALDISAHPFPVHTEFQALVDGTTSAVALQDVAAHFLHTSFNGNGLITRATEVPGHNIALDIHLRDGRTEDLLTLFSKTRPAMVSSSVSLSGHLQVPPGKQRFILKLRVRGSGSLAGMRWSSPDLQQKMDDLSLRAEDHAKQALKDPASAPVIASAMTGAFTIEGGNIDITNLEFKMPGATIIGGGRYPLVNRDLDFHGVARTVATASQMVTGFKSLLLKPISPFLKKHGAGMQIPVSFTGDKSRPAFALDLANRKQDARSTDQNPARPRP